MFLQQELLLSGKVGNKYYLERAGQPSYCKKNRGSLFQGSESCKRKSSKIDASLIWQGGFAVLFENRGMGSFKTFRCPYNCHHDFFVKGQIVLIICFCHGARSFKKICPPE
jgi:hypothetical protein